MAIKKIILCEGVHDLALLSLLLTQMGLRYQAKDWNEIRKTSKKHAEITVIDNSLKRDNKIIPFLIKQDENVNTCIESFWELYKTGPSNYELMMVLDADGDGTRRQLIKMMMDQVKEDVLIQSPDSSNIHCWKKGLQKPAVFIYPGKLTDLVKDENCGNLSGCRDDAKRRKILNAYLEMNHAWINELNHFLKV